MTTAKLPTPTTVDSMIFKLPKMPITRRETSRLLRRIVHKGLDESDVADKINNHETKSPNRGGNLQDRPTRGCYICMFIA